MSKMVIDEQERKKIEKLLNQNILVEAGAGSGKTTCLVNRMVNLIRTGTFKVNEIVAITFTKKAAEELKTRFLIKLENDWRQEINPDKKQILEHALKEIDDCFLGTVHSFCTKLLRERPIEAGLDHNFIEIDDFDDMNLAKQAWDIYFEQLCSSDPNMYKKINNIGISLIDVKNSFVKMKSFPDVNWVYDNTKQPPDILKTFQRFILLLKDVKRAIPEEPVDDRYDALQEIVLRAISMSQYEGILKDAVKIEIFELFNKKLSITQKLWKSKEDGKYFLEKINYFVEANIKPLLTKWYEYVHGEIIPIMKNVMQQYEVLKEKDSFINYQDLLVKAAKLLRDNKEVRRFFQEKYRCLLVDEFQDTDPIQAEIMFLLTSKDLEEKNWTKCTPKPGSLFVVGDPKQAIYRFRRADIDIYNKVKELIVKDRGEVLHLTMNFRTLDSITAKLNLVFEEMFPESGTEYQAAFKRLNSYFEDDHSTFSGIYQLMVPKKCSNQAEIVQCDSVQIATMIKNMIRQGHKPKEFMILSRYNDNLDKYYQALLNENIPASLSGEMVIGKVEEFKELCYLLEYIDDPCNPVKLLAILRGSFFGISDQQLYEWKQSGGMFHIYSIPSKPIDAQTIKQIGSVFEKLQSYIRWKNQFTPKIVIEKIIEDIGFYPLLLLNGYGMKEYELLLQLLNRIREATTFTKAVQQINASIYSPMTVADFRREENSVRVMNVHKSKGLEAEIVFLANPRKKVDTENLIDYHISRTSSEAYGYFIINKSNGFRLKTVAHPPSWEEHKLKEYEFLKKEETRIVYVAATRAEKALFISSCEKNNDKNPWKDIIEIMKPNKAEIEEVEKQKNDNETEIMIDNDSKDIINLEKWVEPHKAASYLNYSPTNDKKNIHSLGIEREKGGGVKWGTMIHEVFEKLVKGTMVENHLEYILNKNKVSIDKKNEVLQAIQQFKQTETWEQICHAKHVLTETPFTIQISQEDAFYNKIGNNQIGKTPYFVKGIIDLVYQYDGKWYIVDYKTDRPKDKSDLSKLSTHYEQQVQFYQEMWERITGTKVHQAIIYYVTWNETFVIS
ncbi:UvrD-helicase domain-containing protein [Heyndrickxia sporothermodurans]